MAGDGPFRLVDWHPTGTPVEQLARQIDKLEKRIDQDGSIVIKTPDVWGESRLMRHRSEVETQLKAQLNAFEFRINAIQSTRDAAFLATAVALQEQIDAGSTISTPGPNGTTISRAVGNDVGALSATPAGAISVNAATSGMIGDPNATPDTNRFVPRTAFSTPAVVVGTQNRALTVNIEPVIQLDQMNRYLQHLNELRRLNEGDDNSDTPGYALNLIRIPVSVLPGRRTEQGFGAEVQITIDPYISDEILPLAFKDFVVNGVVDRISFDVWQIARMSAIKTLDLSLRTQLNPALKGKMPTTLGSTSTDNLKYLSRLLTDPDIQYEQALQTYSQNIGDVPAELKDRRIMAIDGGSDAPRKAAGNSQVVEELQRRLLADINHRDLSAPASHKDMINGDTLDRLAVHAYYGLVQTDTPGVDVHPDHRVDRGLTMPEVSTLLGEETKAAYEFLSQPSAVCLWSQFCTPELARKVRENRESSNGVALPLDSVGYSRREFFDQINHSYTEAHGSVTEALAWQIIVESALVNEQLIKDMRETATLKNCPCIPTDWMPFYGPDPCPEARHAFGEYIRCKWPIHVFALDPVTQDQNISDSFSQRREMQMAMAIAASSRMLGGQAMQRFVRRMEYDLETIQLNRTAVAFSHGDNTFGWRFYPRVQAPPVPGNLKVCVQDLLIGGQDRNQMLNTRRLEPGIRECTALVVMPSFVPQVMVDVRTDWFSLAKHVPFRPFNKRKPDHEDSMELSKQLTNLRCLQTECMNDAHKYRDGDVYRLCKAVERLEDRLPMQTHNVPVPWENDLGGFEVFQSGTQVLGPEIHGWYGAPGILVTEANAGRNDILVSLSRAVQATAEATLAVQVATGGDATILAAKNALLTTAKSNEDKARVTYAAFIASQTDTAVFLVGKNFSVLNCRVIAGGVDVTNTIEVINRNLMQVRIPSTVSTSHTGGVDKKSVVVHLATPYGATTRLLLPVAGQEKESPSPSETEQIKALTDAIDKVKGDAQTAAQAARLEAIAVSDSDEALVIGWGDSRGLRKFEVAVYEDATTIHISKFCPPNDRNTSLKLVKARGGSAWPKEDNTEEFESDLPIDCEMVVRVTTYKAHDPHQPVETAKLSVGTWDISNGNFKDGKPLTSHELLTRILSKAGERIPCDTVKIQVQGYVRFRAGGKVTEVKGPLVFNFEHVEPPAPK